MLPPASLTAPALGHEMKILALRTPVTYMYTQMKSPRPLVGPRGGPHGIKLFVSILNAFGIPDKTFGDGAAEGLLT